MERWHEVVAVLIGLAVLLIFVYPLTFGPPAPQQKLFQIAALLASAMAATVAFIAPMPLARAIEITPLTANEPSRRLAFICTFLC
jgi:hypothetical protein